MTCFLYGCGKGRDSVPCEYSMQETVKTVAMKAGFGL